MAIVLQKYIMTLTRGLVFSANVISATTALIERIPPSLFVECDEKFEKFNGLNFKRRQ
jgi:hypothetical protein